MSVPPADAGSLSRGANQRSAGKALPQHQRANNRALVLRYLFHHGPTSRADLARATTLTRVTISDLVNELMTTGLVEEVDVQRGGVGKPAILVGMRTEAFQVLAIDITSGNLIRGALLTLRGVEVLTRTVDRAGRTGEDLIAFVEDFIRELIAAADVPLLGVGIGSPGIVDLTGRVVEAPNVDWYDVPLAARLSERLGLPVEVCNDSDMSMLGEYTHGRASKSSLVLTIRGGVGGGLIVDGVRVHGAHGAAGELGHVIVADDGRLCACGRRGCLETILSEPALRRAIAGLSTEDADVVLAGIGRIFGDLVAPVVAAFNLGEVILAGPPELLDGALKQAARDRIVARVMPASSRGFKLRMSDLGERVVLVGAVALVLDAQLGVS